MNNLGVLQLPHYAYPATPVWGHRNDKRLYIYQGAEQVACVDWEWEDIVTIAGGDGLFAASGKGQTVMLFDFDAQDSTILNCPISPHNIVIAENGQSFWVGDGERVAYWVNGRGWGTPHDKPHDHLATVDGHVVAFQHHAPSFELGYVVVGRRMGWDTVRANAKVREYLDDPHVLNIHPTSVANGAFMRVMWYDTTQPTRGWISTYAAPSPTPHNSRPDHIAEVTRAPMRLSEHSQIISSVVAYGEYQAHLVWNTLNPRQATLGVGRRFTHIVPHSVPNFFRPQRYMSVIPNATGRAIITVIAGHSHSMRRLAIMGVYRPSFKECRNGGWPVAQANQLWSKALPAGHEPLFARADEEGYLYIYLQNGANVNCHKLDTHPFFEDILRGK